MALPDIDAISTYNGATNGVLQDYSAVENPQTDQPAAGATAQQASTAMMTRTLTRVYVKFTWNGSAVTVNSNEAVWGTGAPPTVTHSGTGQFDIDWPSTVSDAAGGSHSVNLRGGWQNINMTGGSVLFGTVLRLTATRLRFISYNTAATATDPTNFAVEVWGI